MFAMARVRGHRIFAAMWDLATRRENRRLVECRRAAAAGLHGRVLEIGVGVGANWQYLPAGIEYVGIEPDAYMLERARRRADTSGRAVDLHQAAAEDLPFEDATFDSVLVTLTLCSVDDPARALAEIGRVLRPGGELRFWEHVRPSGRVAGVALDCLAPLWARTLGGCHPNRRTAQSIDASGLTRGEVRRVRMTGLPAILGTATKPR